MDAPGWATNGNHPNHPANTRISEFPSLNFSGDPAIPLLLQAIFHQGNAKEMQACYRGQPGETVAFGGWKGIYALGLCFV